MLRVSRQPNGQPEIFYSIQGEGISTGTPAVFLRLAFCNLKCSWCDTKYTWDWEHYDQQKEVMAMPLQEIEERISIHGSRRLIITGGEPLIQQKELKALLKSLKRRGFYIEVETNGTLVPDKDLACLVNQWNVSPKLESSGNSLSSREVPEAYNLFASLPFSFFKYVIQTEDDLRETQKLIDKYGIATERVILIPEAADRETLVERGTWLAELCKNKGYRFCSRLHVLLWGNERGV